MSEQPPALVRGSSSGLLQSTFPAWRTCPPIGPASSARQARRNGRVRERRSRERDVRRRGPRRRIHGRGTVVLDECPHTQRLAQRRVDCCSSASDSVAPSVLVRRTRNRRFPVNCGRGMTKLRSWSNCRAGRIRLREARTDRAGGLGAERRDGGQREPYRAARSKLPVTFGPSLAAYTRTHAGLSATSRRCCRLHGRRGP